MAIDPDLEPILSDITAKLAQLLEGMDTLAARIAVLENAEPPTEEPVDPEEPVGDDSPDGTTLKSETGSIVFGGKVYTLVPSQDNKGGLGIAVDGVWLAETNNAQSLFVHDGKLFQGAWDHFWQRVGDGWGPELVADPRVPEVEEPEEPPEEEPEPVDPGAGTTPDPAPWNDLGELAYPKIAYDEGKTIFVPPGQRYAYIPIDADRYPILSNYSLHGGVRNVSGGSINVGGSGGWLSPYATYWRTGDDARHYVTLDMKQGRNVGNKVEVLFNTQGGGWRSDSGPSVVIEIREGAVNAMPATMPKHRPPKYLNLGGATAAAEQDMATIKWSDTGFEGNVSRTAPGAKPCWTARLAHGYAQVGNGELGAYINSDKFPAEARSPHSKGVDASGRPYLRLHTERLPTPVDVGIHFGHPAGQETYPFQAAVITGQMLDKFCRRRGIFRAQFTSADRKYSWPAFWCIGRKNGSPEKWAIWPPEIDFVEHFNDIYGAWDEATDTSSAQHLGPFGKYREKVVGNRTNMRKLGWAQGFNFNTQIHDYACLIEDDFTWHFVDGVETYCCKTLTNQPNGNTEFDFFPILNVAVKPPNRDNAYDQGSGDMLIYGIQGYDIGSGYKLEDFTDPQPWANRGQNA